MSRRSSSKYYDQLPDTAQYWADVKHHFRYRSKTHRGQNKNLNQTQTEKINYGSMDISFDQTDIERAAKGPQVAEGWYRFTVAADAEATVSKNKGSMMFVLNCLITDEEKNTTGKPLRHYLILPLPTPRALLDAAGFPSNFKHTAPNTSGLVRSYLEATRPTEFPHSLTFSKDEKQWYYNGNPITKQEADALKRESAQKVLDFVTKAWTNAAETFGGDTFYGKVSYQEGRDFPSIGAIRTSLPDGETLVVA